MEPPFEKEKPQVILRLSQGVFEIRMLDKGGVGITLSDAIITWGLWQCKWQSYANYITFFVSGYGKIRYNILQILLVLMQRREESAYTYTI